MAQATLKDIAAAHGPQKSEHLVSIYETYLDPRRADPVNVLEIGVKDGSSIRMWREYFQRGRIFGLDVKEWCRGLEDERLRIVIGSQSDPAVLDDVISESGPLDVVVDDGSHQAVDQQSTLLHLWPHVAPGGLYVIEDIHTSYKGGRFRMGWRKPGTTVEFLKDVVDDVHGAMHSHPTLLERLEYVHIYYRTAILRKLPHTLRSEERRRLHSLYRARVA